MEKVLLIVLGFLIVGCPIAFLEPSTGELREPPLYALFWASIGGIIIVIVYSSYKAKKERAEANRERKRRRKGKR